VDSHLFILKLHAHRAGLPGKVMSFYIVPLAPAYKAGLAGHVPVQPWILGSIQESVDLIYHAAEGMPADSSLHAFPIKRGKIAHPMSERTFSFLLDDFNLDAIGSFHLLTLYPSLSTFERVYED
jgi:hypothetical protein